MERSCRPVQDLNLRRCCGAPTQTSFPLSRDPNGDPMQDDFTNSETVRRIPFKQEGWGFALFVVFLAVASAAGAAYVHKTTFKAPTDVRFHAVGTTSAHE
jgi:hypothetical protein